MCNFQLDQKTLYFALWLCRTGDVFLFLGPQANLWPRISRRNKLEWKKKKRIVGASVRETEMIGKVQLTQRVIWYCNQFLFTGGIHQDMCNELPLEKKWTCTFESKSLVGMALDGLFNRGRFSSRFLLHLPQTCVYYLQLNQIREDFEPNTKALFAKRNTFCHLIAYKRINEDYCNELLKNWISRNVRWRLTCNSEYGVSRWYYCG